MSITEDVQKLEPGNLVELFELDATEIGGDILRFHGYLHESTITWQGLEYEPWPIEVSGFEITSDSKQATPSLSVGNVDGSIGAMAIYLNDLVGAKLTRRRTLAKYLDGQPEADPEEQFAPDIWFVEVKTHHDKELITWELKSALDLQDVMLPRRVIVQNLCAWAYRSADCGYTGPAVADFRDRPTNDPSKDMCSKSVTGCKLRFGNGNLPFGGFPSATLTRT